MILWVFRRDVKNVAQVSSDVSRFGWQQYAEHVKSNHYPKHPMCPVCQLADAPAFKHTQLKKSEVGALFVDLGGPFMPDVRGYVYFVVGVWIGLSEQKGDRKSQEILLPMTRLLSTRGSVEVLDAIGSMVKQVETMVSEILPPICLVSKRVLRIHSDRAGEFTGRPARNRAKEWGVYWTHSGPASSQSNGRAEVMVRIVKSLAALARRVLVASRLPVSMWGFAVLHVAHSLLAYRFRRLGYKTIQQPLPFGCWCSVRQPGKAEDFAAFENRGQVGRLLSVEVGSRLSWLLLDGSLWRGYSPSPVHIGTVVSSTITPELEKEGWKVWIIDGGDSVWVHESSGAMSLAPPQIVEPKEVVASDVPGTSEQEIRADSYVLAHVGDASEEISAMKSETLGRVKEVCLVELCCYEDSVLGQEFREAGHQSFRFGLPGTDLLSARGQECVRQELRRLAGAGCLVVVWISVPCSAWSTLQRLNAHRYGEEWLEERRERELPLIQAVVKLGLLAVRLDCVVIFEWPRYSEGWGIPVLGPLFQALTYVSDFDGCAYGLHHSGQPIKKPWRVRSNRDVGELTRFCRCAVPHLPCEGGSHVAESARYTPGFAQAVRRMCERFEPEASLAMIQPEEGKNRGNPVGTSSRSSRDGRSRRILKEIESEVLSCVHPCHSFSHKYPTRRSEVHALWRLSVKGSQCDGIDYCRAAEASVPTSSC